MADTGQDDHDRPPTGFTVGTLEVQEGCLGPMWRAAAAVCAGATVAGLEGLHTGAVLIGQVNGSVTAHHPLALAASLWC